MKFLQASFEELNIQDPLLLGERCTRVCYKSENLTKEGSAYKLLLGIISSGHTAMIEHIPVYLKVHKNRYDNHSTDAALHAIFAPEYYAHSRFEEDDDYVYISTNLRVLYEVSPEKCKEFLEKRGAKFFYEDNYNIYENCKLEDSDKFHKRITILFTMDRIGSQSFCRHRVFSFAQESTRWCNYMKDKFGAELSVITPCWLKEEDIDEFEADMIEIEKYYFKWINKGYKAEEARSFLPFAVKTELIMTGFADDWIHFFELRDDSHAHPQARELAAPLKKYFIDNKYIDIIG